jgi:hypothetical protein
MEIDHKTETVRMDWHRYAPDQVETWADRIVEAAHAHGFRYVEFVHGAADVVTRGSVGYEGASVEGRGRIKQILRRRLYSGRWSRLAEEVRSGLHQIDERRMLIALRSNDKPDGGARWPVIPPPAH